MSAIAIPRVPRAVIGADRIPDIAGEARRLLVIGGAIVALVAVTTSVDATAGACTGTALIAADLVLPTVG